MSEEHKGDRGIGDVMGKERSQFVISKKL